MELRYDQRADAAAVLTNGEIGPEDTADVEELDADRIVRFDAHGQVIEYQFFNVRRYGVRVNDLPHREALETLFQRAGIAERDWSEPVVVVSVKRRQRGAAAS